MRDALLTWRSSRSNTLSSGEFTHMYKSHVHTSIHAGTYTYMHTHVNAHRNEFAHHIHIHMYVGTHVHTCISSHTCVHTATYACQMPLCSFLPTHSFTSSAFLLLNLSPVHHILIILSSPTLSSPLTPSLSLHPITPYRRKAESIFTRFSEMTKRPAAVKKALDSLLIVRNKVDAWVDKMPQARTLLLLYLRTCS